MAEAQRHYEIGKSAYIDQRYEVAFAEFTKSYQISKVSDLLYNLAQVAIKLDQREVALGYFRQYLRHHPPDEAAVQKEVDGLFGAQASAAPVKAASDEAAGTEPSLPRWVGWALIGTSVALVGTSIGLLVAGGISPDDTSADKTQRRALLATGGVLSGLGIAAGVGGAIVKLRERGQAHKAPQAMLLPLGAGLQLVGTF